MIIVVLVVFVGLTYYTNNPSFKLWSGSEIVMKCHVLKNYPPEIFKHDGELVYYRVGGEWKEYCSLEELTGRIEVNRKITSKGITCSDKYDYGSLGYMASTRTLDFEFYTYEYETQWEGRKEKSENGLKDLEFVECVVPKNE